MEIFSPELHSFPLRAFLDEAKEILGAAPFAGVLAQFAVTEAELADSTAWVSLEFVEALLQALSDATGEPDFVERSITRGMTPKYIGALYPLLFALGSPSFTYRQLAPAAGRLNKTGHWTYSATARGSARLEWRTNTGTLQERNSIICETRLYQLRRIPTLFALPAAQVDHPECLHRAGSACVYDCTWEEPPSRHHGLIGFLIGGIAGGLIAEVGASQTWLTWMMALGFGLGGWAFGRLFVYRQDLRHRLADIERHNHALDRTTRAAEARYAELLEAKAEVDRKVEQRTKELRGATQQLSEALNKLQEIDRAKTDFFNNVSHELRSPLTLILAPLEELMGGRLSGAAQQAAFQTMHRNASRLVRLINQLLDLAKIDAGQMRIATEPTDLSALMHSSLAAFDAAARNKGVKLQLHVPDLMPPVLLDASWIESAVTNLLANALRLTNPGGAVRLSVTDRGADVVIAVSDDGPGVALEDQKRIFERFMQGDGTRRIVGGTGIGLALVREAARLHGGDVSLESELGRGSTFSLQLPRLIPATATTTERSQPSLPPKRVLVEEFQSAPSASDRPGPAPGSPLALVVEDNVELRAFIADVLATRYSIRTAPDAVRGIELARQLRPDVVVSDVAMPEMDGFELCRRLQADPETSAIPILLLTARTDIDSVLKGFSAGASDYLLKPFHATELLARVQVHVQLRRMTGRLARQERLAALGTLAASVAHNVRNPLSALISGLPAIRQRLAPTIDASSREMLGLMLDCAERIERMTVDLLDLSRIDREVSGEFSPGTGLLACTRMFGARITHEIELRTDVDQSTLAIGRAGEMNHVFMNVLDNALLAIDGKGTVEVTGRVEGDSYVATIADSGAGIEPTHIEAVFEPFWTTRAAGEGTGLGLSIARQIMDEHGGTITAGSSPLGGAQFTIRLPIKVDARAVA